MTEPQLRLLARQAEAKQDYSRAAVLYYWLVQKTKTGQYNLACYLARTGKTDDAFYWLQVAALEEGVDKKHAERDEDLTALHQDPRWAKIQKYLEDCNRYFAAEITPRTVVVLPKGYKKETPIPVILWMHGLGSTPDDFVNESCQKYADELNIAIVGVSGTFARGPHKFAWAENPGADANRLRDALEEVGDRLTIKPGQVITFGFSQGAQVGLELAARFPDEYAGSIALSPGAEPQLEDVQPSPLLAKRAFVVACGANEAPGNVQLAALDAAWLRKAKAHVQHKAYPGMAAHAFPPDFDERFPEWVKFILETRRE